MKQAVFDTSARLREIATQVARLENELKQAHLEIAGLRTQLASTEANAWARQLLDAYAVEKGNNLYRRLFDTLPDEVRRKGRMSPYILSLFSSDLPGRCTFADLQRMKATGELTDRQIHIYDAINTFKSQCSYRKWLA